MPKKTIREFLTIEQALSYALKELSEQEVIDATKKKKNTLN